MKWKYLIRFLIMSNRSNQDKREGSDNRKGLMGKGDQCILKLIRWRIRKEISKKIERAIVNEL